MMKIVFTVTNDLNYDQRMIRICSTLSDAGYDILLIGRKRRASGPLLEKPFRQKRIGMFFEKGFGFYAEYNIRLFFYLLFHPFDAACCIDLDTMLPVYYVTKVKRKIRIYDAHEYFTQQIEVVSRPRIYRFWHFIEKRFVPKFKFGYTVNHNLAALFEKKFGVHYGVIRNVPFERSVNPDIKKKKRFIYSGSVNEGRGFEQLIPAMQKVDACLDIYGSGNFFSQVERLIHQYHLENKVVLKGYVLPEQLATLTCEYTAGITLFENTGLNQYLSLANRFFDYIQCGIPQLCMDYPEYRWINDQFEVALLIKDLEVEIIAHALNVLLKDEALHSRLSLNCIKARKIFSWQNEENKLIQFYKEVIG